MVANGGSVKILFVSNSYPWPLDNGAVQRSFYLADTLARHFQVTLVAQTGLNVEDAPRTPLHDLCEGFHAVNIQPILERRSGPYGLWRTPAEQLRTFIPGQLPGFISRWWSPETVTLLERLDRTTKFDLVWCERAPVAEAARSAGCRSILVDLPDMESQAMEREITSLGKYRLRPIHALELKKLRRYERQLPERYAHVTVCKEDDRHFLGTQQTNVSVVPNGVKVEPAADRERAEPGELLFVGSMGYYPNIDAVVGFAHTALPLIRASRADVRLRVVGKEPAHVVRALHDGLTIDVTGPVPDIRPYYDSASVVVAPIQSGAGTRIKILEALMFGKAVVATPTAIEGLDLSPGVDLEVAGSPDAFAAACLRLLNNPQLRVAMGDSGRNRVLSQYSWQQIGRSALEAVDQVIRSNANAATPVRDRWFASLP